METENIHIIDEAYGFKSGCYTQTREGIVFSVKCATGSESYILKPCLETADRKIFTYAIHSHLNQNGFSIQIVFLKHLETVFLFNSATECIHAPAYRKAVNVVWRMSLI